MQELWTHKTLNLWMGIEEREDVQVKGIENIQ
jgi:hypothetical protein